MQAHLGAVSPAVPAAIWFPVACAVEAGTTTKKTVKLVRLRLRFFGIKLVLIAGGDIVDDLGAIVNGCSQVQIIHIGIKLFARTCNLIHSLSNLLIGLTIAKAATPK